MTMTNARLNLLLTRVEREREWETESRLPAMIKHFAMARSDPTVQRQVASREPESVLDKVATTANSLRTFGRGAHCSRFKIMLGHKLCCRHDDVSI